MESPDTGTIVTVQRLRVTAGRVDAFVARFREVDVLALAAAEAGGELVRAMVVQDGSTFLVITVWSSSAGIDRWSASRSREVVFEALGPYYDEPPSVGTFTLCDVYDGAADAEGETV